MPNFKALSRENHADKFWRRNTTYRFALPEVVVPLVASELPHAMMAVPIAFMQQGESYVPAALMGLAPGKSLYVAPDGSWSGNYVPAVLRAYPFMLANSQDGQKVLCFDEDSGLLSDGPEGERFFDVDGLPSQGVKDVLAFLQHIEQSRAQTLTACAALAKHGVIKPWVIALEMDSGEKNLAGLYQIDEVALNALDDSAFLALRKVGAVAVAYCQLFSMQNLRLLGRLAEMQAKAGQPIFDDSGKLDLEFLKRNETISFGNLQ